MTFQVGDIVRKAGANDNSITYCVQEVGDEYGIELVKVDDPRADGWWEHQFWELAPDVRDDARTAEAQEPKPIVEQDSKEPDPVLLALNEKLTLAAAAVIHGDKDAINLITDALVDVRTAIEA
jgi:hypothetical protein